MVSSSDENVFQTKEGDCVSTGWQAIGRGSGEDECCKIFRGGGVCEKGLEGFWSDNKQFEAHYDVIRRRSFISKT